jgi:hypothetical protein
MRHQYHHPHGRDACIHLLNLKKQFVCLFSSLFVCLAGSANMMNVVLARDACGRVARAVCGVFKQGQVNSILAKSSHPFDQSVQLGSPWASSGFGDRARMSRVRFQSAL